MRTLTLSATTVRDLRDALLAADERERFAFLYAGDEDDLLGSRVVPVDDADMASQSRTACRPSPAVERTHVGRCYEEHLAPVLVHSHPFSAEPRFSSVDVESMGRFREWLSGLFPDESFGFAVVGTDGIEAVGDADDRLEALPVEVIGDWKLDVPVPDAADRFALTRHQSGDGGTPATNGSGADTAHAERDDRTVRALGADGQRRLRNATVGIVGVGGLGSLVAEQLARLGVEELVVIDPDDVEESNLSRLAGAYDHHVGAPKVTTIREHLWKVGADGISLRAIQGRVEEHAEELDDCDVVVGCVDSVAARSFCNEYAVKQLTYYVDAGVRIDIEDVPDADDGPATDDRTVEMTGYVHLVAPGSNACFDCLGRHDRTASWIERMDDDALAASRERGYLEDDDLAPEPAVVHLNGLCASKTVSILVDLMTGGAVPPDFVRYEDHDHEMTALTTEPSDACPTCGTDGVLGVGRRSFGDARITSEEPVSPE